MNDFLSDKKILNKNIRDMVYMAVMTWIVSGGRVRSTFLRRFEAEPQEVEKIRRDDIALYEFAMKWVEYGLIGHTALKVNRR